MNFTDIAEQLQLSECPFIHTRDIVCMPVLLQAVEMYTDLCQFDMAKHYLSPRGGRGGGGGGGVSDSRELLSKQADWARNTNDPHAAW